MGYPGFGLTQTLGLVAGILLSLTGLLKVHLAMNRTGARALSTIYLSMILFAGLSPGSFNHTYYKTFPDMPGFNGFDLLLNTVGFIPLGFLLMLSFGGRYSLKKVVAVTGLGALISFFLETSQYYFIPGRVSSMIDLVTNILGTLIGIVLYLVVEGSRQESAAVA